MYIVRCMAYTTDDPAIALFQQIFDFEGMYYDRWPDKETYLRRIKAMQETRRHLILDAPDRSSYEVHVTSLDHYKKVFQELHSNFDPLSLEATLQVSYHTEYQSCLTILKLLTGRFRLRMLLHELQQIHESMV